MSEVAGSNGSALAVVPAESMSNAQELRVDVLMRRATDVAGVCREIVMRTAQSIPGSDRKHVKVEGWESIAAAYGYCAGSGAVEAEERNGVLVGFKSKGVLRRLSDGVVVAEAEGFVGEDEPLWAGGGHNRKTGKPYDRRPEFARRAMAQTRAISRVCRGAFAFVVTLIDNKLSTTPAEEMDGITPVEGNTNPPAPAKSLGEKLGVPQSVGAAAAQHAEAPPHTDADFRPDASPSRPAHVPTSPPTHDRNAAFAFGRDKGVIVADLSEASLKWYSDCFKRDLADASKSNFHAKTQAQLSTVAAELKYRGV